MNRHVASVAHPEKISSIAISNDGNFAFTSGENSAGVHVWQLNPALLAVATRLGGEGLQPFLRMLDGMNIFIRLESCLICHAM